MKLFNSSKKNMLGQGMTEYIIIVALIAIAAIGVFGAFGDVVKNQVAAMALELGGKPGGPANTAAGTAGDNAKTKADTKSKLNTFTGTSN